jgi:hypothetical protein
MRGAGAGFVLAVAMARQSLLLLAISSQDILVLAGCMRRQTTGARFFKNLVGQRFGRLLVLAQAGRNKHGQILWLCICDCKNETVVSSNTLKKGHTQSCGCLQRDKARESHLTHGLSKTREYSLYHAAKGRCTNPRNRNFADYGGRGIQFLLPDVEQFVAKLGHCPPGQTLERIDNDGHYELGNLKWATRKEQSVNRRKYRRRRSSLAALQAYAKSLAAAGGAP